MGSERQIRSTSVVLDLTFALRTRGHTEANVKSATLVPTFRSSCYLAAATFHELRKVMGTSKSMTLVPLFYLKFLNGIRGS